MFKKICVFGMMVMGIVVNGLAETPDISYRVARLESDVNLLDQRLNRLEKSCTSDLSVVSEVSLSCLKSFHDHFSYVPNLPNLIDWASNCRGQVNISKCTLIQTTANATCVDLLLSYYQFQPNESTLEKLSEACESKHYICSK